LGTSRLSALATRIVKRLRSEGGFGLIELLVAMVVTTIAVMALVAALTSAHVTLVRAGRTSTSAAIASAQMERYRALKYADIRLSASSVTAAAAADNIYDGDSAWDPDAGDRVTAASGCTDTQICNATQTVTGADGRSYRLDTFIVYETPASGRQVKRVTVVVRDGTAQRVRETSAFDEATSS
jgi:type II secretory pathway pseudopilin PulG